MATVVFVCVLLLFTGVVLIPAGLYAKRGKGPTAWRHIGIYLLAVSAGPGGKYHFDGGPKGFAIGALVFVALGVLSLIISGCWWWSNEDTKRERREQAAHNRGTAASN